MDRDASRTTRVASADLEPWTRRISPGQMRVSNCGRQEDPGMTGRRLEGACGSEIRRPGLHAVNPLRLAQKLHKHIIECPGVATEAWGCAGKRSLESGCGFSADVRLEVLREGSRPPGECVAAPGVVTRNSGRRGGGHGSGLARCCRDARVRPQQRGCGATSVRLRHVQRSRAKLQQRGGVGGRQAGRCAASARPSLDPSPAGPPPGWRGGGRQLGPCHS